jgi:hypothetical protein
MYIHRRGQPNLGIIVCDFGAAMNYLPTLRIHCTRQLRLWSWIPNEQL